MHAAGVVISQKAVDEYVPLSRASDGSMTTQFTMTTLEELGLLKMDFLGLRTLTVIQNAVQTGREEQRDSHLDMDQIDYDDKKVLDSIGTGKTDGVFQLESTRHEELHEGAEAAESGGYHRRYLPVSSGPHGFHSAVYQG